MYFRFLSVFNFTALSQTFMLIYVVFYVPLGMVHPDNIAEPNVSQFVSPIVVSPIVTKAVDVREQFVNRDEFVLREDMLQWIRTEATKLGFGVVIGRSDNGTDRRNAFVTLTCERGGKYMPRIRNFKREDTGSRKCECPFKLRGYMLASNKWKFNVLCGLHNHDLSLKLAGHPIACRLLPDEKTCVSDMTLNLVPPKNILATLKRKRPENTSNIKQVYNKRYQTKIALREDRTEMQHLLKLLDENNYVCRHRRGDDGVTVRDIYWTHLDSIKLFNTFPIVLIIDSNV